ncbi:MAG: ABC transporter substrate-binding protein [Holosporaceae bacterium]|jgi:phospholipid transport system substrate-binding protein|nr:ABC transporter substrate-binding protein [Holosporaceae bacterium]
MKSKFRLSFSFILAALILVGGLQMENAVAASTSVSKTSTTAQQCKQFIERLGNQALDIINAPNLSDEEVMAEFEKLVNENFSIDSMANFCLGRYARVLNQSQKTVFTRCFVNMLVRFYASNFKEYKAAKFVVSGAKEKAKSQYLIETRVQIPGKKDVIIIWSVRHEKNGEFKIRDATTDDVSMAQIQRAEISGSISEKGVEKFMNEFETKYAKQITKIK